MTEDLASSLLRRFEELKSLRKPWEQYWEEIRKYVLPRYKDFYSTNLTNLKSGGSIFDSTAPLALEKFASALDGMLTPRTQMWHGLRAQNDYLNELPEVKIWFESVVDILFQMRYAPKANFATNQYENYLSLGAFGTSVMFIESDNQGSLCYRAIPLGQVYLAENNYGKIDTIFREFSLSARQAKKQWPNLVLAEDIENSVGNQPDKLFNFLHCVFPASELDEKFSHYASIYISLSGKEIIETGQYRNFPYAVSRYTTNSGEIYGRSPAMTVLADIKMLNEMEKTQLRAIHQQLLPPLLAPDSGTIRPITVTPGAINYGGVDSNGKLLIQPLYNGAKIEVSEIKMNQKRKNIEEAFLVNLFQMLLDNNNMTATEVLKRTQEKGLLLAPMIGRQQSESLDSLIERELDLLAKLQILPPLPLILAQMNASFSITYDGPINRMQRSYKAESLSNILTALAPFLAVDPSILNMFDIYAVVAQLADVYGLPEAMLRSKATVNYSSLN